MRAGQKRKRRGCGLIRCDIIGQVEQNEEARRIGTIFVRPLLGVWMFRSSEQKSRGGGGRKQNRIFVGFQMAFIPVLKREIGIWKPNETRPRIGTIFVRPLLGVWMFRSSEQKSWGRGRRARCASIHVNQTQTQSTLNSESFRRSDIIKVTAFWFALGPDLTPAPSAQCNTAPSQSLIICVCRVYTPPPFRP